VGVRYDPLLAKLIAYGEDRDACVERLSAALADTVVLGVTTNLGFLRWAVDHPRFRSGLATTSFVEEEWSPQLVPELPAGVVRTDGGVWHAFGRAKPDPEVLVDGDHALYRGWAFTVGGDDDDGAAAAPAGGSLAAPMPGTVLRVLVAPGDRVAAGQTLVLLEAMKMELAVSAPGDGTVSAVHVEAGQLVQGGAALAEIE
jgi:acetyl/propionyl-CoA carboxylase alpha subunit